MKNKVLVIQALRNEAESFWMQINKIADSQFEFTVKPWLIKKGYTFQSGMGAWAVYVPHTGHPLNHSDIPKEVLEVLTISIPLYDHDLGSIMPEFPDD
jgi:hypothetical protein